MKTVHDKIVLITGAASGIGRLMALDFARRGARVVVWDIDKEALKALEAEARQGGLLIKTAICDVSGREAVYRQAEALKAEWGPADILINNAGIVSGSTFLKTPDEKIMQTMAVNVLAPFWTCKAFLPSMLERNSGHIVNIASAAGIIGVTGLADYSASKFAVFGFNESLRMELRRQRSAVRTTVVCPFFIDTGMFRGVKTRFPLLLPILKSEYAARRIVAAVLKNRKSLIMPRFVYSVFLLRLFPPAFFDAVVNFFGINHSMDHFQGRNPG
ncbi:MAG: SDR family oxidoreductase [Treponema sp.]|jgi:all-trans-retinol dehydrogenase (NAD+)|nr:SDR family oxidoreductase [Treponema sp.]